VWCLLTRTTPALYLAQSSVSVLGSLLLLFLFILCLCKRQRNHQRRNRRVEDLDPPMSQVMWMWHDVDRNDYDQEADLDAQLRSPGEGSPVASGDERDAFLRRSGDLPGGTRNGEPTARLVDAPRSSQDSSGRPIGIALTAGAGAAIASRVIGHNRLVCQVPPMVDDTSFRASNLLMPRVRPKALISPSPRKKHNLDPARRFSRRQPSISMPHIARGNRHCPVNAQ
jgi:hypothetical protein